MNAPLESYRDYDSFSEAYEIVCTALLVMDGEFYRIEVLRRYSSPNTPFTAHCWLQSKISVPLSSPETEEELEIPQDIQVWTEVVNFPWIDAPTADAALTQALGFLADMRKKG